MNASDRTGCPATRHGTDTAANNHGCRCPDARAARLRRRKHAALHGSPHRVVPGVGTARRIHALRAIGWPYAALAVELGTVTREVWRWTTQARVRATTRDRVAEVYERLSGTPGPSPRARESARRAGWAPPLLWDGVDLDDPAAEPLDDTAPLPPRLDLDEVEHLARYGVPLDEIAARLGVRATSIERARQRAVARGRAA